MVSSHGCLSPSETIFLDHMGASLLLRRQTLDLGQHLEPRSFSYPSLAIFRRTKWPPNPSPCNSPTPGSACRGARLVLRRSPGFYGRNTGDNSHQKAGGGSFRYSELWGEGKPLLFMGLDGAYLPGLSHFKTTYFQTIPLPVPSSSLVTFMAPEHDSLGVSPCPAGDITHGSPAEHASTSVGSCPLRGFESWLLGLKPGARTGGTDRRGLTLFELISTAGSSLSRVRVATLICQDKIGTSRNVSFYCLISKQAGDT